MVQIQLYPAIVAIYQQLYRQATMHPTWQYQTNRNDRKLICKFIEWLHANYKPYQLDDALLVQYFEFQFSRYAGVVTPRGKNNIMLNWVIGKGAINSWTKRKDSNKWFVRWKLQKEFKQELKLKLVKQAKDIKVIGKHKDAWVFKLNSFEEQEKLRFYNDPKGYIYCGQFTTLFNPNSPLCTACSNKQPCIERLQKMFPKAAQLRGV